MINSQKQDIDQIVIVCISFSVPFNGIVFFLGNGFLRLTCLFLLLFVMQHKQNGHSCHCCQYNSNGGQDMSF